MSKQPHVPIFDSPEFDMAVRFFGSPMVTIDPDARTPYKDVYEHYIDWCLIWGCDRISKIYFSWAAAEHQIVNDHRFTGHRRHLGVRLNTPA